MALRANARRARTPAGAALFVGALGVVFGDLGTSPIYTVQTVFNPGDPHPVAATREAVFGVASLIFWSVTIIVTVTYVLLVMRADNDGEGGIMALITLIRRGGDRRPPDQGGARRARHLRRLAVLRRQHDHAGHLRPLGGRGPQGGPTVARASRRPHHSGDHRRPVHAPAPRLGSGGEALRPGHARLVRRHRRLRGERDRGPPGGPQGALAHLRARLLLQSLLDGLLRAGGGRAGGHRRRGPVRRHGPFRARPDHAGVAVHRLPRLHPELPGPGRAAARAPRGEHRQPVLPAGARLGALAARLPGHGSDRGRLASGHHGRLLRRLSGRPARLSPAPAHPAYLLARARARSTSRRSTGC